MFEHGMAVARDPTMTRFNLIIYDVLTRVVPAIYCLYLLNEQFSSIRQFKGMLFVSRVTSMLFIGLSLTLFLIRIRPLRKASGAKARLVALAGAFLMPTVPLFSPYSAATAPIGSILIVTGSALSIVCLYTLGRSFSIMAEARRLVTRGPYRFVRHPLYASEAVAGMGLLLTFLSPAAVAVCLAHLVLQYGRMRAEERVLSAEFPEYESYKVRTPMIFPRISAINDKNVGTGAKVKSAAPTWQ
jgi:protein-S-isoprenylcysteine O-methyltransferase Ste14